MKKILKKTALIICATTLVTTGAHASSVHTVKKGDTMWKISVQYQKALSELLKSNTHIQDPTSIYPGDKINIPEDSKTVSAFEKEVAKLVNEIRSENGLEALTLDKELSHVARKKSEDMSQNSYFSHESPTYGSPFEMMESFGISYRAAAENIAKGQKSPKAVVNAWMNSSGHRKNILSSSYTHIGVGHAQRGNYWTQMFIGK